MLQINFNISIWVGDVNESCKLKVCVVVAISIFLSLINYQTASHAVDILWICSNCLHI